MSIETNKLLSLDNIKGYLSQMEKDPKQGIILTFFGIAFTVWQVTQSTIAFFGLLIMAIPLIVLMVLGNIKGWKIYHEKKETELTQFKQEGDMELEKGKHYFQMDFLNRNTGLLVDVINIEMDGLLDLKQQQLQPEIFAIVAEQSIKNLKKFNEMINLNIQMVNNPFEEFVLRARNMLPVPQVSKDDSEEILDILDHKNNIVDLEVEGNLTVTSGLSTDNATNSTSDDYSNTSGLNTEDLD